MGLLGDDLEGVLGVAARQQRRRDGNRAVDPALALLGGLVQAGVADGDTRLRGQHPDHVEVVVVERAAAALLGQIQIPEDLPLHPDRNPEEAPHRRMVLREPAGAPVVGQVRAPHRPRVVDERPEQPLVPVGQPPDPLGGFLVDPVIDEVREPVPVLRHDPDGRVPRVRQLGRRLADPVQRGVQLKARPDRPHRLQQLRHARGQLGRQPLQAPGRPSCPVLAAVRVGRGGSY